MEKVARSFDVIHCWNVVATWKSELRGGLMSYSVRRAFAISIVAHLIVFGLWTLIQVFDLERFFPFRILPAARAVLLPENKKLSLPPKQQETVLTFIEVDPTQAVKEPPPDTKFYSAVSTEAANPTQKIVSDVPNLEGQQEKFLKLTENEQKSKPLQPTPQPAEQQDEEKEEQEKARPKEQQNIGDIALLKPQEKREKNDGKSDAEKEQEEKKRSRPRTLAAAAQAKAAARGDKSKVEGGVARVDISSSVAARGTLQGDYDARFVDAVRQCWYDVMFPRTSMKSGRVVVEFRAHHDGRISDVHVVENTTEDAIQGMFCEVAITKPAPFEKWSPELRREFQNDVRELRFTFHYD